MEAYNTKFQALKEECKQHMMQEALPDDPSHDAEYKRIKTDILNLLLSSRTELSESEYSAFKQQIIEFLCRYCGCHLDVEVLSEFVGVVLSEEEFEYIQLNSALARWL